METKPTFEQAQLHLRVYEERREERLRKARDWFFQNYWPESFEESMKLAGPGTEGGTNFMMVVSYWEQACALLDYDLLHEDLFFETSGEFFGVFERIRPGLQQARDMWKNPYFWSIWKTLPNASKPGRRNGRRARSPQCVSS